MNNLLIPYTILVFGLGFFIGAIIQGCRDIKQKIRMVKE